MISRWTHGEKIREVLQDAGLSLEQEKRAFVWNEPQAQVAVPERLMLKPLPEIGDDAFVCAIERAVEGTLDQADQEMSASESHREIAEEHFNADKDYFGFEPEWWQLAENREGQTVGFVQPAYFKGENKGNLKEGTVVYIGVVPEHRGHGYSVDLLFSAHSMCRLAS